MDSLSNTYTDNYHRRVFFLQNLFVFFLVCDGKILWERQFQRLKDSFRETAANNNGSIFAEFHEYPCITMKYTALTLNA